MAMAIFGVFLILHGLVHLLYAGQCLRIFELQPGMLWPDGSWAFSPILGNETARSLALPLLVTTAIAFVVGGAGALLARPWWHMVVLSATVLSTIVFILYWDVAWQNLDDKGAIGIGINLAIVAAILLWF